MPAERIVSLVPGATETLFELGVGERVQAVSHACDHPPEVAQVPTATRTRIDGKGTSRQIDEAVQASLDEAEPMFEVLGEVLHHAQPDLVVAQEACDVCGITPVDVEAALARIEPIDRPEIVTLHPHTLADVLADVRRLADTVGAPERGQALDDELQRRIEAVEAFADERAQRPGVAALDWLDPPMAAGHWLPDMVKAAGGRSLLVDGATPSTYVEWSDVVAAEPEVLLLIPCGFTAKRAIDEAGPLAEREGWADLPAVRDERVYALDAGAYASRPGPRLVDGLEQIACLLHGEAARRRWPGQAERVEAVPVSP